VFGNQDFVKRGILSLTVFEANTIRSQIAQMYAKKSARNADNLMFYDGFGLFEIAVIAQQIYDRYPKYFTTDLWFSNLNKVSELSCNRHKRL
jgi:aminoglycoside phosphotransferase (APT) family kinase protein